MARVKNTRGGPVDSRLTAQEKGKAKKTTTKKWKLVDVEAKRAAAAERAERGGAPSGVRIVD